MGVGFSFQGASGEHYTYAYIDKNNLKATPMQAGNFVFARSTSSGPIVIYAGEANSMYGAFLNKTIWNSAWLDYKANMILIHPRFDKQARQMEQLDLVKKYKPPMNAGDSQG